VQLDEASESASDDGRLSGLFRVGVSQETRALAPSLVAWRETEVFART
jgi:hypothetical protein